MVISETIIKLFCVVPYIHDFIFQGSLKTVLTIGGDLFCPRLFPPNRVMSTKVGGGLSYNKVERIAHMWLMGPLNLYEMQQSWEPTFLKLYHYMKKKWGIKRFFTFAILRNHIFETFT